MAAGKQVTLDLVYNTLISLEKNVNLKIDGVRTEIVQIGIKYETELAELKNKVEELQTENNELIKDLKEEKRIRRRGNLIIFGIVEQESETDEKLLEALENLFVEKLQITGFKKSEIFNAYRLGRKSIKSRAILVELNSLFTKKNIFNKRRMLKGTNIYIRDDLIPQDRAERRILIEELKRTKIHGKTAFIKRNKLIIDGEAYSAADITRGLHLDIFSPPPNRLATSEPATPTFSAAFLDENNTEKTEQPKQKDQVEKKKIEEEVNLLKSETIIQSTSKIDCQTKNTENIDKPDHQKNKTTVIQTQRYQTRSVNNY